MVLKSTPTKSPKLKTVKDQFETWRATRKDRREPIPPRLWDAACQLADAYLLSKISKTLRIDYAELKTRVQKKNRNRALKQPARPTFIELNCSNVSAESECIIEMQDTSGSKMRMCFRGKTGLDLLELGKAFWSKGV